MPNSDTARRWYQNRGWAWGNGVGLIVLSAVPAFLARKWYVGAHSPAGSPYRAVELGAAGLFGASAAALLLGGIGLLWSGIAITDSGLVVRKANGWHRKVPWASLEGFQPIRSRWNASVAVGVIRTDRKPLRCAGVSFFASSGGPIADPAVAAMIESLELQRQAHVPVLASRPDEGT